MSKLRRQRLLAQQRLARGDDRVHEIAVRRRRRDDHDRFDVGVVDDGLRVGRDPFERQMLRADSTASAEKSVTATGRTSPSSASSRSAYA